jgi:hypothetical protein
MSERSSIKNFNQDQNAIQYFIGLKELYKNQRAELEPEWEQATASVYMVDNKMDKIYNGRARVNSPIMLWKVRGVVARIIRIIFNFHPIGRLEAVKDKFKKKGDLWDIRS